MPFVLNGTFESLCHDEGLCETEQAHSLTAQLEGPYITHPEFIWKILPEHFSLESLDHGLHIRVSLQAKASQQQLSSGKVSSVSESGTPFSSLAEGATLLCCPLAPLHKPSSHSLMTWGWNSVLARLGGSSPGHSNGKKRKKITSGNTGHL